jgi:glycerate dehydrogenase
MALMKLLYIGVCKENLEKYHPAYLKGDFLEGPFTDDELVHLVQEKAINVFMVDVIHSPFTPSLLHRLKGWIKLINFSYQSIESLVDLKAAAQCGIMIKKLPVDIYCKEAAEFAIAQLLCACKGIISFDRSVKKGEWNQAVKTNISLQGKTLGVVGYGNIGREIVKRCESWGMDILVTRKHLDQPTSDPNATLVDLLTLVEKSNFVILALPIKEDTFQLINRFYIDKMQDNTILINISRGNIVDETAVCDALKAGKLHSYCTDVFSKEPVAKDHVLLKSGNTIFSPHIAWATDETLKKTYEIWFNQTYV